MVVVVIGIGEKIDGLVRINGVFREDSEIRKTMVSLL
jgi:hypothetical protein